ncbi:MULTISPECIES: MFS transporter [unclassified Streptomyces]|uniref:MFS transporter n=1 Tax=unclassified Streptomyces TaxID=2593676 RepID=UPI00081E2866|nr:MULTISPECIES: MFS transporter [unclassified Streptomyces]MYZ34902.1 MFS transporter [Streptomyces sp. SID4917]SCF71240.1 Predicted arabinose efflux permease, MFS family [Streptomyces sp. MnatMP-M17]
MAIPEVLRNRDFTLYWGGVILSQIGTRGAVAANLYQVYQLTGSTAQVGLVGLAQAVALLVLSPLGGIYADRLDRRRLLQVTQCLALLVAAGLAVVTLADAATVWTVVVSSLLATAAATFDQPARQALIPAMVPKDRLVDAFALLNPSRELAVLTGPALAGLLIAAGGPGAVYVFDAVTYGVLVVVLAVLRVPPLAVDEERRSLLASLREGVGHIGRRPVVWQLMGLDLAATVFGAYRVLLPAFAEDVLHVGATGYGLLSAAPSAGALIGSVWVFRLVRTARSGHLVLWGTAAYGLAVVGLAQSRVFPVAIVMALALGAADALATTVRHAAVQVETPDTLRGRVSAIYQMCSRGGPAIGDTVIGALAGVTGPVLALTLGGLVPAAVSGLSAARSRTVRDYSVRKARPATT